MTMLIGYARVSTADQTLALRRTRSTRLVVRKSFVMSCPEARRSGRDC